MQITTEGRTHKNLDALLAWQKQQAKQREQDARALNIMLSTMPRKP